MVTRSVMIAIFAAVAAGTACDVDRNLDPSVFACESGGTCDPPRDAAIPDAFGPGDAGTGTGRDALPDRADGGFDLFDIYIPDIYIPDIHIPDIFIPECYPFC